MATKAYVDVAIGSQSISNTGSLTIKDTNFTLQDDTDITKQVQFQLSGITTGQTRILTVPDANMTLVGTDATQTLTQKTISGASNTLSNIPRPVVPEVVSTSSASSLTLTTSNSTYVYTGSSATTWTLPAVSGNTGVVLRIINRSTAIVTLQRAGTDNMYISGATSKNLTLAPGALLYMVNDGTYWTAINSYLPNAAVTFDAVGSPLFLNNPGGSASGSGSHTAAAGSTVWVVVNVIAPNSTNVGTTRTVTYDPGGSALAMTSYTVMDIQNVFGNVGWQEWFYIKNAPGGAKTWTISVTGSAGSIDGVIANSVSYMNANYIGPAVTNNNTSTTALSSGAVMTGTNHMVAHNFYENVNNTTTSLSGYNQTTRYDSGIKADGAGTSGYEILGDAAGTNSTVSFTATASASTWYNSIAVDMSPIPWVYIKGAKVTNGTTVNIPTHAVGDVIVIFAYRSASVTTPTKPAASGTVPAWVDIDNNTGANTNSSRTAYFVATATNHTSGTWTNATCMIAVVLTGQNTSSPIGGHAESGGASTTSLSTPSVTMSNTSGSSALLSFFGCAGAGNYAAPPAGYTEVANSTTLGNINAKNDTTSDGSYTQTANTAGVYRAATIEIIV